MPRSKDLNSLTAGHLWGILFIEVGKIRPGLRGSFSTIRRKTAAFKKEKTRSSICGPITPGRRNSKAPRYAGCIMAGCAANRLSKNSVLRLRLELLYHFRL